jgi:hypothetical protein
MEKNNVKSVNPTALTGTAKENKMNKKNFDFVEILCIASVLSFPLAIGVIDAETFYMGFGDCAIFLAMCHFMTLVCLAVGLALEEGKIGKVVLTATCAVISGVVGAALYKLLALGLGAGVDYTSVAAGTIIGMTTMLSILTMSAMVDVLKKN